MRLLRKTAWLALTLASFVSQASVADDLVSSQLVDEAREWQQKDRDDRAASVWRKLLRAVPQHPEALINLGLIEVRAGNRKEAQALWTRANQLKVPPARLSELAAGLTATKSPPESTQPIKPEQSQAMDALTIVIRDKPAENKFAEIKLNSEALLASYQTPNAIKQQWTSARRGLEKLARDNPRDGRYAIALARHLSYREGTLRESIRQIGTLTQRNLGNKETQEIWQKALLSLKAKTGDRALFTAYLTRFPDDKVIRERLLTAERQEATLVQSKKIDIRSTTKADVNLTDAAVMQPPAQATPQTEGQEGVAMRLTSTLQLDPQNPWVRQALARQNQNNNAPEASETTIDKLNEAIPARPEALYARVILYSTQKKWWEALSALERIPASARTASMATEQRRLWVNAQVQRALQLFKQSHLQQANALMDQVQDASGADEAMLLTVVSGWSDLGQPAKGLRLMRHLFSVNPVKSMATQIKYAQLLLNDQQDSTLSVVLGDLATAGRLTEQQQEEVNHVILGYTLRLTELLRESGRYAEAAATINPALLRLDDNRLLLSKARIYKAEGDFSAALELVERVILREPNDISHRLSATELALAVKNMNKATGHVKSALDQAPNHPRVLALAGRVEKEQGNMTQALDYFQRAQAREFNKNAFFGAPGNLSLRLLGQEPDSVSTPLSTGKSNSASTRNLLPIPEFKPRSERTPAGLDSAPLPTSPLPPPTDPISSAYLNTHHLSWATEPDIGHGTRHTKWLL